MRRDPERGTVADAKWRSGMVDAALWLSNAAKFIAVPLLNVQDFVC